MLPGACPRVPAFAKPDDNRCENDKMMLFSRCVQLYHFRAHSNVRKPSKGKQVLSVSLSLPHVRRIARSVASNFLEQSNSFGGVLPEHPQKTAAVLSNRVVSSCILTLRDITRRAAHLIQNL